MKVGSVEEYLEKPDAGSSGGGGTSEQHAAASRRLCGASGSSSRRPLLSRFAASHTTLRATAGAHHTRWPGLSPGK